jgi:flagellar hook-basal body complex protein FliE
MGEPPLTIPNVPNVFDALSTTSAQSSAGGPSSDGFVGMLSQALGTVSSDQAAATSAENAVAKGDPNASMASALVLSDRAELGWNAVVAVRNEVTAAYQSIMNMTI